MKKLYAILFLVALIHTGVYGQAKKPTIMVVPANVWCTHNGYTQKYNNQGTITEIPDYKKALDNDLNLVNVITKIGELMAEKDFPLKDMASSIRSIEQSSAEHEMTTSSTSGASLAESPLDRLMNRAKADILIEVVWNINTMGPKRSVTYTLRGLDAYTNKQVAATQGTGEPSMAAEVAVLLEEAVVDKMDAFVSQLQKHFDDLMANGREVALEVRVFEKYGQDYKLLYKKRSKKLQIEYLLICLGYFNGLSLIMITFTALLRGLFELLELESRMASSDYKQFLGFLVYMGFFVLLFTGQKYWKKITERLKARENVTVLAVEHGYPIFATKEEA